MTRTAYIAEREDKPLGYFEDIIENFRREMVIKPWQAGFRLPSLLDSKTRVLQSDMADNGNSYELKVEEPGIDKDKMNVKATSNSIEISAEQSLKTEEKKMDYVNSERSHGSHYRKLPISEEIVPSRIEASMNNGILVVKVPKRIQPKLGLWQRRGW